MCVYMWNVIRIRVPVRVNSDFNRAHINWIKAT